MKFLKDNKGMTLVEISVGFLLMTVVMIISGSIIMFSNNMFARSATQNKLKMTADEIFKIIEYDVQYATHVQVDYRSTQSVANIQADILDKAKYENVITVIDGDLYMGTKTAGLTNVYKMGTNENTYKNGDLRLVLDRTEDNVLKLGISVEGDASTKYETCAEVQLISMDAMPNEIKDNFEIEQTNYVPNGYPTISFDDLIAKSDEMPNSNAYTVDQRYVPTVDDRVVVIDGAWPSDATFKTGDYVVYNGELFRYVFPNVVTEHAVPPGHEPGQYAWWLPIDKNLGYDKTGGGLATATYGRYETVKFDKDNQFYMSQNDALPSTWTPDVVSGWGTWRKVYWFSYKAKTDKVEDQIDGVAYGANIKLSGRNLGWSLNPYEDSVNGAGVPNYPDNNYKEAVANLDIP